MPDVTIEALSTYSPQGRMTKFDLAELSGIPATVWEEKFGFTEKRVSAADEHVSDMGLAAAGALFQSLPEARESVGAVIYCGSSNKDFGMWSCASFLAHELGLRNAYAFEIMAHCAGFLLALSTAKSILLADDSIDSVLLVAASEDSTLVDFSDIASKSVFNFGDGAAAALVTRSGGGSRILSHAAITDGQMHNSLLVPAGGTVEPASLDSVRRGRHSAQVNPTISLRDSVTPIFVRNIVDAAHTAAERADLDLDQIDHVVVQNQIPSVHRGIVEGLGLPDGRVSYLRGYGHMSSLDPLFALRIGAEENRYRDGDKILLLAAGLGYTWSAMVLEWSSSTAVHSV